MQVIVWRMIKKEIIVDDLKVVYFISEKGRERPLVFLHGWQASAMSFASLLGKIDNYLALDLPGFGGSQPPQRAWGTGDYADFLKRFLEKLNVENPVLVGHSFGGSIVIKYLAELDNIKAPVRRLEPARPVKAILIDSAGIRKTGLKINFYFVLAKIAKLALSLPGLHLIKDRARQCAYQALGSDYPAAGKMTRTYQKIIREDLRAAMGAIDAAVFIIWGEHDTETPLEDGKRMNELIKNSKLRVIEGAGHWPFLDQEREFMAVLQFILNGSRNNHKVA